MKEWKNTNSLNTRKRTRPPQKALTSIQKLSQQQNLLLILRVRLLKMKRVIASWIILRVMRINMVGKKEKKMVKMNIMKKVSVLNRRSTIKKTKKTSLKVRTWSKRNSKKVVNMLLNQMINL